MEKWDDSEANNWSVIVTSTTNFGAMIGSLSAGSFTKYGKKRMILVLDFILLTSIAICMVNNILVITFGRFFWGLCAGSFSVMCPKYLNEYLPIEKKGTYGALNQLMCTVGIMVPSLFSLAIPADPKAALELNPDDFLVTGYWRFIWLVSAGFAALQILLLVTCFNYETPVDLLKNGEEEKLQILFKKMYGTDEAVEQRIKTLRSSAGAGGSE